MELLSLVEERDVNILCLQEQFLQERKIHHIPTRAQILNSRNEAKVKIIVQNTRMQVFKLEQHNDKWVACVEVLRKDIKFILVCAYFQLLQSPGAIEKIGRNLKFMENRN